MGVTILPQKFYDALDVQNALLASIASKQDGGITIKSWEDVQRINRMGLGEKLFVPGDQFVAEYNSIPTAFNIIGINHDIPTDPRFKYSITIQPQDCLQDAQFSNYQALYYAEEGLPAGEHIFTIDNFKYKFTTGQAVPEGGQVVVVSWQSSEGEGQYVPTKITTYAADRATSIESGLDVTIVEGGMDTLTPVNHHTLCRYGSNNYIESAIKQWLNSEATSFKWLPKTNFDRPPIGAPYTGAGFLKLLDPELVAVLGAVDKQVARNTVTDGGGQDTFSDKVFLLSRVETGLGTEGTTTGERVYSYYDGISNAGRIKLLNDSPRYWWLRSPSVSASGGVRGVTTSGAVSTNTAGRAYGLAPACVII
jgi:hypothetical protein